MNTNKRGQPAGFFASSLNSFTNLADRRPIVVTASFLILCFLFVIFNGLKYVGNPSYDLRSFYAAAKLVFLQHESPYNLALVGQVLGPHVLFNPFLYPPSSALMFLPLAYMSYAQACNLVLIINDVLYLAMMWIVPVMLLGFKPRKRPAAFLASVLVMLLFNPTRWVINLGEVDILCLSAIILFWILAKKDKPWAAGLFLAVAIVVKTYPVVLLPFLFLTGRRREIVHTFIWLGITLVISYIALPHVIWSDWLRNIVPAGGYLKTPAGLFPPSSPWNQGLNGFFARLFMRGGHLSSVHAVQLAEKGVVYLFSAACMIVTAVAVWRSRKLKDNLDRCMIVTLPAIFLIAPFSYLQHLVYLIPTILFVLFSKSMLKGKSKPLFYSLLVVAAIVIAAPKTLHFEFFAVLILWGLTAFAVLSGMFEFNSGEAAGSGLSGGSGN